MIYRQCPSATHNGSIKLISCVMFAGHKPIRGDIYHNYGGLGPYTPGVDPATYVPHNMYMPLWRRLLALVSRWESELEYAKRRAIPEARRRSRWLGKRPFSDKYGYGGSVESSRVGDYFDDVTGHDTRRS